jgi:hypothetical protein
MEIESEGFDFRVAGKGFVWSYPERELGRPRYDGWPLVLLRLDRVDVFRLEELVTDAWQMRRDGSAPQPPATPSSR